MKVLFKKITYLYKNETVLGISATAALFTMFLVPPSADYLEYLDLRVLSLLFCLMAVVAGLNKTGVFIMLSEKLLHRLKNTRTLCLVLILLCFFSSMWITNDVALITFVPFALMILDMTGLKKHIIFVVVMQTIAANLGSMLTPVGNPQNLYLYSTFDVPVVEFFRITLPITVASFIFIFVPLLFVKKESIPTQNLQHNNRPVCSLPKIILYSSLFLICLACVLRFLDYRIVLIVVFLCILLFDRSILKKVDFSLLITFVCFFVFVGNIGVSTSHFNYKELLSGRVLPISIILSQFISNVPAAVLLSTFTDEYKALILGTNIGGLGTLVASLASLISYKFYMKTDDASAGKYLFVFTIYNLVFLILLVSFYWLGSVMSVT
ncbi:MAG: sodium/sulfate symporter [Herbinix sp.]|jgi:Na+/H+ antiporter NhaD/arsenite permease-like protein|nr:sodium/sulfate symporter [Herbinix sp.]